MRGYMYMNKPSECPECRFGMDKGEGIPLTAQKERRRLFKQI